MLILGEKCNANLFARVVFDPPALITAGSSHFPEVLGEVPSYTPFVLNYFCRTLLDRLLWVSPTESRELRSDLNNYAFLPCQLKKKIMDVDVQVFQFH